MFEHATPPMFRIRGVDSSVIADMIRIGDETGLSPWSAQGYLDEMKSAASIMLRLVTEDNELAGFVVGRIVAGGQIEVIKDAEILNIAVARKYWGTGGGQMLFDAFIDQCREHSVVNIWLEVRASNQTAIDFYKRNGFVTIQTRRHFYHSPSEDALLMRASLKKANS